MGAEENAHITTLLAEIGIFFAEKPDHRALMERLGYPVTLDRLLQEWETVKMEEAYLRSNKK